MLARHHEDPGALLIVSRDKDLLDLMNETNADGRAVRTLHPGFEILTPPQFLELLSSPGPRS